MNKVSKIARERNTRDAKLRPASTPSLSGKPDGFLARDWLTLLAILGLYFLMRWPFRELPLIRDEGEYAHMGQVMASGKLPYVDAYNQKPPLVFLWTAFVQALFGSSLSAFRVATNVYGTLALALWLLFTRRHFGTLAMAACGLAYCLLGNQIENMLHQSSTEFYLLLWFALAILVWFRPWESRDWLRPPVAGICVGLAMQTKQTGAWLFLFLAAERGWHWFRVERKEGIGIRSSARDVFLCGCGVLAVQAVVMLGFLSLGAWESYWECVWANNYEYIQGRHARYPLMRWLEFFHAKILMGEEPIWLFALAGLALREFTKPLHRTHGLWLLFASTLAMGYMARQHYVHYFLPMILPVSLGCGIACGHLLQLALQPSRRWFLRIACLMGVAVPFFQPIREQRIWLFQSTEAVCGGIMISPFFEAKLIAPLLAERTEPGEPVFIVGSDPEIYFYANRPNATRLVLMYPMTGPYSYAKSLLDEFIHALEDKKPRYVLLVNKVDSLTEFPRMTNDFVTRVTGVLHRNYEPELMVVGNPPVLMRNGDWSKATMTILKRKATTPPAPGEATSSSAP